MEELLNPVETHEGVHPYRIVLGEVGGIVTCRLLPAKTTCTMNELMHSPCIAIQVRNKLGNTKRRMEEFLAGLDPTVQEGEWYDTLESLAKPLLIIYR